MDKYRELMNHIHNELGITKDDIRDWIKEAVAIEAKKMVDNTYEKFSAEAIVEKQVKKQILDNDIMFGERFKKDVIKQITENLKDRIEIVVSESNKKSI